VVLVFENIFEYTNERYFFHLEALPCWRREHALKSKLLEERKKSVLSYILLCKAAKESFGVSEIPEFSYNECGKPYIPDRSFFFSISHSKTSVAVAVSQNEIGLDIQNIVPLNERISEQTGFEIHTLQTENKDEAFSRLWAEYEAVSKFEGTGIRLPLVKINKEDYLIFTEKKNNFFVSVCYGKKGENRAFPKIEYIEKI